MANGFGAPSQGLSPNSRARLTVFHWLLSISLLPLLAGCAAPSEPLERKPPVAQEITDLAAVQDANDVVLTFTLPTETVDRRPLKDPLGVEIYRGIGDPGADSRSHMTLLATIPAAEVNQYVTRGQIRYVDSLRAEDFAHRDVLGVSYSARTRASVKKASDSSNIAYLMLRPALDPIADLKVEVTQSAIVLAWTAPQKTLSGSTPSATGYRIYRQENANSSTETGETSKVPPAMTRIGESEAPAFQDTDFEFGKTYAYSVRSVAGNGVEAVESADSNLVSVVPRDTFPPAAPLGLVVALVPGQTGTLAHLELSWSISPETDLAGYNVYRSEGADTARARSNTELLLAPSFRDMNVEPGHRYFYTVTAVDRAGNESPSSEAASGDVPR